MNIRLISDLPVWFIFISLAIGLLYALFLYYKERKNEFSSSIKRGLGAIRFVVISAIALLLMAPMIQTNSNIIEKPIVVFAQDNSESIINTKDSSFYKTEYIQKVESLVSELKRDYEVASLSFNEKLIDTLSFDYNGKLSDLESLSNGLINQYTNRNLGAVVLATDGIFNKGANPLHRIHNLNAPVYTIALGDTAVRKDVLIKDVKYNKIAYLGNYFPVEIIVGAEKYKGKRVQINVLHKDKVLYTKNVQIKSNSYIERIPVKLEATEVGMQKYSVTVSSLKEESSRENNYQNIYIDILDSRQKVLILYSAPNPDVSAIKSTIATNQNYTVESFHIEKFNQTIKGYNLIILHGLPSSRYRMNNILTEIDNSETPVLFVISSNSYFQAINRLKKGLTIAIKRGGINEVKAIYNKEFSLFNFDEGMQEKLKKFPPLSAPFGSYSGYISSHVLFKQQIGSISSSFPLVVFNENRDSKTGFIAAEGLWRWRLADFKYNANHDTFNGIVSKIIQYLCIKVDKSLFRVNSKNTFNENESIEFSAELYNDSYELVNDVDVEMVVFNQTNRYPYAFRRTSNAYHLNIGSYPPGEYNYIATASRGGNTYTEKGLFTVKEINIESIKLVADHHLLYNISEKSGAKMVYPQNLEEIEQLLENREDIVSISYPKKTFKEIINLPLLLVSILIVLSLEWFIRKWKGGY